MYMKGIIHHGLVCLFDPKKKKKNIVSIPDLHPQCQDLVCACLCVHMCVCARSPNLS